MYLNQDHYIAHDKNISGKNFEIKVFFFAPNTNISRVTIV